MQSLSLHESWGRAMIFESPDRPHPLDRGSFMSGPRVSGGNISAIFK
jgi:hypothetical protein